MVLRPDIKTQQTQYVIKINIRVNELLTDKLPIKYKIISVCCGPQNKNKFYGQAALRKTYILITSHSYNSYPFIPDIFMQVNSKSCLPHYLSTEPVNGLNLNVVYN